MQYYHHLCCQEQRWHYVHFLLLKYVLRFTLTAILFSTLLNAFSLLIQIYFDQLNFQINSTTLYQLDLIFVIVLKCKISLSHTHKHINTHTLSCVIWIPLCLKYLHKYTEIFVFNEKNWPLPSQKCNITSSHLSLPRTEMTLHALPSAKICFQVHTDSSEQEEQRSGSWKLSHFMVSNIR